MAKKKLVLKKVKPPKKAVKKSATVTKTVAKKPAKPLKAAAKPAAKSSAKPTAAPKSAPAPAPSIDGGSLGRPLVTQEEKLYMLFHEDYEARQVFEFLQVETVADLERHSHEEIIRVLTAPVRRTVQRIRQRLAEKNRSLLGDEEFTRQHKARLQ
jgi:hypothetical protein